MESEKRGDSSRNINASNLTLEDLIAAAKGDILISNQVQYPDSFETKHGSGG